MPTYYPQINGNLIITQLPYSEELGFGTIIQDVSTGMRWAYPLRGAGLSGYPSGPLSKFSLNYPMITDAEINALYAFFKARNGSYDTFRFLDPGGNLLKFSETFSNSYWNKTSGYVVGVGVADPFGRSRATSVNFGNMGAVVGPSDGGMQGMVLCASMWVMSTNIFSAAAFLGFVDESTSIEYGVSFIPFGWTRVSFSFVVPTNNQFNFYFQNGAAATIFGAQVSPMKGEGGYVETPGNFAYHANCRFDTDSFAIKSDGPNQNAVALPVVEFWVNS